MSNSTHRFKFAISSTHTYVEYCYQAKFSFFLKFKKNLKLLWWMNFHIKFRGSFKKYTQKKSVWNGENFRDNHTWSVQDNFHNCVKNEIFNNIHTCNICNINLKYTLSNDKLYDTGESHYKHHICVYIDVWQKTFLSDTLLTWILVFKANMGLHAGLILMLKLHYIMLLLWLYTSWLEPF